MNTLVSIDNIIKDNPCFVGMGNSLRKDDGLGIYILEKVQNAYSTSHVTFFNVEDIIESYVYSIANCANDTIIIIDAIEPQDIRIAPGSILFGRFSDFFDNAGCYSTHKLSLRLSSKILEDTGKKVFLLGIVPADIDFGKGLTPAIKQSADHLADTLIDFIKSNHKESAYVQ